MDYEKYYTNNKKYSIFLDGQDKSSFKKYSDYIIKYSKNNSKILDTGCGTGLVLEQIKSMAKRELYGIEVSRESIKICLKKKLNCQYYDGKKMPFKDSFFDCVGSMNVLEHTNDPVGFLNEQKRILKKGGYLIVSCPNFLSVTNSYHHHTAGVFQKLQNLLTLLLKYIRRDVSFEKMRTIDREDFQPDDDACNVTNPLDVLAWGKQNKLSVVEWSSQQFYTAGVKSILDRGIMRLFLGSSFIVFKK